MNAPPLRHWLLGLALSICAAWAAGAIFLNTVQPLVFDPQVRRWVPEPGTAQRTHTEGWATARAGAHGIRGLPGGKLPDGAKVVFWGDSYVEGVQVNDAERMPQAFTRLAADAGLTLAGRGLCGVGIGTGGDSLIDSLFKLPDYALALRPVALHVFFLGKLTDVLPDIPRLDRANFRSLPEPALVPLSPPPPSPVAQRLASAFNRLELGGVYELYRKAGVLALRLRPGPVCAPAPAGGEVSLPPAPEKAWEFLLAELQRRAGGPVLLLYAPTLPYLARGQVRTDDFAAPLMQAFARTCQRLGVPLVDLGPVFITHFQATGRLPRGFPNTMPGIGHLNADGHRLAAQAVLQHITEHRNALLAP